MPDRVTNLQDAAARLRRLVNQDTARQRVRRLCDDETRPVRVRSGDGEDFYGRTKRLVLDVRHLAIDLSAIADALDAEDTDIEGTTT